MVQYPLSVAYGDTADEGTVDVSGGHAQVELSGGGTATIGNLPIGTTYSVEENTQQGWENISHTGDSGVVEKDTVKESEFVNEYHPSGLSC